MSRPENGAHTAPAVSVNGLVKRYGELEAVRGIDFATGETFGVCPPCSRLRSSRSLGW